MPKLEKAKSRDKKRHKAKHGQRVSGKSVFLLQEILIKRAESKKKRSK